jgi:hypothetical protein
MEKGAGKAMLQNKRTSVPVAALLIFFAWLCVPLTQAVANGPGQKAPPPAQKGVPDIVRPGDRLQIWAPDALPNRPIKGAFRVEPSGTIALGPGYGRLRVAGMSVEQAESAVRQHLSRLLQNADVSVTRYDPLPDVRRQALEQRVQQLEDQVRALQAIIEKQNKQKGN